MDKKLIENIARAIAREFLAMDGVYLDEKDVADDYARHREMYQRMARAALAANKT